jgi:hypothetical protein
MQQQAIVRRTEFHDRDEGIARECTAQPDFSIGPAGLSVVPGSRVAA